MKVKVVKKTAYFILQAILASVSFASEIVVDLKESPDACNLIDASVDPESLRDSCLRCFSFMTENLQTDLPAKSSYLQTLSNAVDNCVDDVPRGLDDINMEYYHFRDLLNLAQNDPQIFVILQRQNGALCHLFNYLEFLHVLPPSLFGFVTPECFKNIEFPFQGLRPTHLELIASMPKETLQSMRHSQDQWLNKEKSPTENSALLRYLHPSYKVNLKTFKWIELQISAIFSKMISLYQLQPHGVSLITNKEIINKLSRPFLHLSDESAAILIKNFQNNFPLNWLEDADGFPIFFRAFLAMLKTGVNLSSKLLKVFLVNSTMPKRLSSLKISLQETYENFLFFKEKYPNGYKATDEDSFDLCSYNKALFEDEFEDFSILISKLKDLIQNSSALVDQSEYQESINLIGDFNKVLMDKEIYLSKFYSFCGVNGLEYLRQNLTGDNLHLAFQQLSSNIKEEQIKLIDEASNSKKSYRFEAYILWKSVHKMNNFVDLFFKNFYGIISLCRIFLGNLSSENSINLNDIVADFPEVKSLNENLLEFKSFVHRRKIQLKYGYVKHDFPDQNGEYSNFLEEEYKVFLEDDGFNYLNQEAFTSDTSDETVDDNIHLSVIEKTDMNSFTENNPLTLEESKSLSLDSFKPADHQDLKFESRQVGDFSKSSSMAKADIPKQSEIAPSDSSNFPDFHSSTLPDSNYSKSSYMRFDNKKTSSLSNSVQDLNFGKLTDTELLAMDSNFWMNLPIDATKGKQKMNIKAFTKAVLSKPESKFIDQLDLSLFDPSFLRHLNSTVISVLSPKISKDGWSNFNFKQMSNAKISGTTFAEKYNSDKTFEASFCSEFPDWTALCRVFASPHLLKFTMNCFENLKAPLFSIDLTLFDATDNFYYEFMPIDFDPFKWTEKSLSKIPKSWFEKKNDILMRKFIPTRTGNYAAESSSSLNQAHEIFDEKKLENLSQTDWDSLDSIYFSAENEYRIDPKLLIKLIKSDSSDANDPDSVTSKIPLTKMDDDYFMLMADVWNQLAFKLTKKYWNLIPSDYFDSFVSLDFPEFNAVFNENEEFSIKVCKGMRSFKNFASKSAKLSVSVLCMESFECPFEDLPMEYFFNVDLQKNTFDSASFFKTPPFKEKNPPNISLNLFKKFPVEWFSACQLMSDLLKINREVGIFDLNLPINISNCILDFFQVPFSIEFYSLEGVYWAVKSNRSAVFQLSSLDFKSLITFKSDVCSEIYLSTDAPLFVYSSMTSSCFDKIKSSSKWNMDYPRLSSLDKSVLALMKSDHVSLISASVWQQLTASDFRKFYKVPVKLESTSDVAFLEHPCHEFLKKEFQANLSKNLQSEIGEICFDLTGLKSDARSLNTEFYLAAIFGLIILII